MMRKLKVSFLGNHKNNGDKIANAKDLKGQNGEIIKRKEHYFHGFCNGNKLCNNQIDSSGIR